MRASCQRRETGYTKTRVYELTHEAPSPVKVKDAEGRMVVTGGGAAI